MFGRRSPEAWAEMEKSVKRIDAEVRVADELPVKMAIDQCRTKALIEAMPPVQSDAWKMLVKLSQFGNVELMKTAISKTDINQQDLLDMLYLADQLAFKNKVVTPANRSFFRMLYKLVEEFRGVQMDETIRGCFGVNASESPFRPVDRHLIGLINQNALVKDRLDYYANGGKEGPRSLSKAAKEARRFDMRDAVAIGMEKLDEGRCKFNSSSAVAMIILMRELGLGFEPTNLGLIEVVRDRFFLSTHMQYLLELLGNDDGLREAVGSGDNTVISALVPRVEQNTLVKLINSGYHELYDERLKALAHLRDFVRVDDDVILELMLSSDLEVDPEVKLARGSLRASIIRNGGLGKRGRDLGLNNTLTMERSRN